MRPDRSATLALLLVALVLASGCLGVLTGSEPAVFTAAPTGVDDAALSETDFSLRDEQRPWTNRTVEVAGQEREVRVRNHVATYEIPPSLDPSGGVRFGLFVAASTPQASVAGQAMNPIGRMSHREMVERLAADSGNLRDVERVGARQQTVLGSAAEVVRFSAVAERSGQSVPVYVEVVRVQHDGDFVIGIGAYPQESADVGPQVETMFGSLEH